MDIKLKNTKYKLSTKIIAVMILWVSLVASLGSGVFLLTKGGIARTKQYEELYEYREYMNRLAHNTVELATKLTDGGEKPIDNNRYNRIENNLSQAVNFNYYIKNLTTNKETYKIPKGSSPEVIKNDPKSIYISKDRIPDQIYYDTDIRGMLTKSPQEIYIVLNDPLVPGDEFYEIYKDYNLVMTYTPYAVASLLVGLLLILITLGYLIIVSGKKEADGPVYLREIDRIYNDIQSLVVGVAAIISVILVASIGFSYDYYSLNFLPILIIIAIDVTIGITYLFSMIRQFKKGVLFKNTLLYKLFSNMITIVNDLFSEKLFKPWMLGILLGYGVINGWLFHFANSGYGRLIIGSLLIIAFNAVAIYFAAEKLKSLMAIMETAKEISKGNLDYQMDQTQMATEFKSFAKDIQSIQGGLKAAVEEAIKGERMKTDLITNVSHDLKTPLTSIINYVDLLKQEEIGNENAHGYIDILEDKSYRLKQLIEDLIEASKASSGNITITKEEVDLQELMTQASGEYEEKIQDANLEVRMNTPEDKTFILADGKYMWRIIENLMSNALKYAMPGSRIYIDIEESNGYGRLTMKNVSAYPLDIEPSELTERFTRADESRTTEGSGLGLSIAQSLTSIQDGKFNIEIDGDLFKVIVEMPLLPFTFRPKSDSIRE